MDETQDKTPRKIVPPAPEGQGRIRLKDLEKKRAQNLRDNLAKRKQQARERAQDANSSDR